MDIYFKWNDCPSRWDYTSRAFGARSNEYLFMSEAEEDGWLYIGVYGENESDFILEITCNDEEKMCYELW